MHSSFYSLASTPPSSSFIITLPVYSKSPPFNFPVQPHHLCFSFTFHPLKSLLLSNLNPPRNPLLFASPASLLPFSAMEGCQDYLNRSSSIRRPQFDAAHLRPQNPCLCQESVDSLTSRVLIPGHDEQFLYSGALCPGVRRQALLFAGVQSEVRGNSGVSGFLQPRLLDYGNVNHSDLLSSSSVDRLDDFLLPHLRNLSINGLSPRDTRGFLGNGLVSRVSDSGRTGVANRMPNYSAVENLPLQLLRGRILGLAKDQSGCRLVQESIEDASTDELDLILSELIEHIGTLMIDQFGNYVVQKLIEVCSEEQRRRILVSITRREFQLLNLCLNMHGTRAVQKLLDRIKSPQEVSLVMSNLGPHAVQLAMDANGQHVIKHCLNHFPAEDNKCLLDVITRNCSRIAIDKSGCCVIQQCVDHSHYETRDALVAEITNSALTLSENKYGNYVVQHILGLGVPRITANVISQLKGHFRALSCDKYGSNVVEKCLNEAKGDKFTLIISELLRSPNFPMLLVDPYGNFVIQAALSASKDNYADQGAVYKILMQMIKVNIHTMRTNIYGKKVLTWIQRNQLQY